MPSKSNQNTDLIKAIEQGVYKNQYLIYSRKSTDEANNQKNSISYQKSENTRFALKEKLPIALINIKGFCVSGVISERHSGFKEDDTIHITEEGLVQYKIERPKFQKLIKHLSKGHFKGIVCLCWDRISRNKGDDTIIRKLMRKGIDVHFVYANYDNTSAGALHMDIDGMFAQHHSRVTSEKVRLTTKNARESGKCTYRAPIGYLNMGSMDYKPFDPKRAPIIKQLFENYAQGGWSLASLARFANEQGMKTVPMRRPRTQEELLAEENELEPIKKIERPITANLVSKILKNPFYTGKIKGLDGAYIKSSSHEALVNDDLFQKVQMKLLKSQVSVRYSKTLDLPLRGLIRCGSCKRVYTPYTKKNIQYYSARCKKGCTNKLKSFNFNYVSKRINSYLHQLYFSESEIVNIDASVTTRIALLEEERHKDLNTIQRQKTKIRENLAYLRTNKLDLLKTGVYTAEDFINEELKLNNDLEVLSNKEIISDAAMHETMKEVKKFSELLKNVSLYYDYADSQKKDEIIRIIFSELFISEKRLIFKLNNVFKLFETRFNALCDPTDWISELYKQKFEVQQAIFYLRTFIKTD